MCVYKVLLRYVYKKGEPKLSAVLLQFVSLIFFAAKHFLKLKVLFINDAHYFRFNQAHEKKICTALIVAVKYHLSAFKAKKLQSVFKRMKSNLHRIY